MITIESVYFIASFPYLLPIETIYSICHFQLMIYCIRNLHGFLFEAEDISNHLYDNSPASHTTRLIYLLIILHVHIHHFFFRFFYT